jgi:hypothetical protein
VSSPTANVSQILNKVSASEKVCLDGRSSQNISFSCHIFKSALMFVDSSRQNCSIFIVWVNEGSHYFLGGGGGGGRNATYTLTLTLMHTL